VLKKNIAESALNSWHKTRQGGVGGWAEHKERSKANDIFGRVGWAVGARGRGVEERGRGVAGVAHVVNLARRFAFLPPHKVCHGRASSKTREVGSDQRVRGAQSAGQGLARCGGWGEGANLAADTPAVHVLRLHGRGCREGRRLALPQKGRGNHSRWLSGGSPRKRRRRRPQLRWLVAR